ncbi:MAG: thioredoxin domain-containing protein [Bacteroidales bacterium]|nr:thioredoxin domain-containing protein [Bacteroidales bacterium]
MNLVTLIILFFSKCILFAQSKSSVIYLDTENFKKKVFNYTKEKTWNYKGEKPCIIDFYAEWCRPCKIISPYLDEISNVFKNKIYVYKVNIDKEKEVAQAFGISSIPAVLFVPIKGQPQLLIGAHPKEKYYSLIKNVLKVE